MESVAIHTATIRLDQLLKLVGAVPTGGAVKPLMEEGRIFVNGVRETARRRQLSSGDVVKVRFEGGDEEYEVRGEQA
ncbi:MAG: RNA-binding S4 domain-containing protein [Schwartzia sp.]|nr:RNA-binding S4 domain-containing protein [Schwartzia sp. (in: firmicutes)]MBR1884961.1 RNA-binding S4 domain-containing protein [Schwartzia sp. (in: firmicutes)]